MVSIDEKISQTVKFLRDYCGIRTPSEADEFRRDAPLFSQKPSSGTIEADYENLQKGLSVIEHGEIENYLDGLIEDSEDCVVIDIGSHFGIPYPLKASRRKPKTRFILVDRLTKERIHDRLKMERETILPEYKIFENQAPEDDPTNWMNSLLAENGYENVRYLGKELAPNSVLDEVGYSLAGKRIMVTGIKNPHLLSLATANIALHYNAEHCIITPSALELLKPEESGSFFKDFAGRFMTSEELKRFLNQAYDSRVRRTADENSNQRIPEKFDYEDGRQMKKAIVLKQMFALALTHKLSDRFDADLKLINHDGITQCSYNQPDHLIEGRKRKPVSREPRDQTEQTILDFYLGLDPEFIRKAGWFNY